ncbi:hypothetical protein EG329_008811 [Mollisiaceae sp. DMI_Dod_QoI]|nr:hypothetical protein EG329_008811 [Helotiales sp. DMI_Dod_QoI]
MELSIAQPSAAKQTCTGQGSNLSTMSSPTTRTIFEYEALVEEDAFRLIFLQPSRNDSAPIQCSIKHSTLSHYEHELQDHYTALSYVWGDPNDLRTIFVDRKPVQITTSLESALRHLREQESGRVLCLWADALCINQTDISEKNHQVQQMGAIYATAHHTVIYLGVSTTEIDFAFEQLQLFQRRHPGRVSITHLDGSNPEELQTVWNILGTRVLTRPWFKRVWVFQELVLSHDPWIQCGTRRIRWDKFCEISSAIEKQCANVPGRAIGTVDVTEKPQPNILRTLHEMQTRRCEFHYTIKHIKNGNNYNSLLDLLSLRRGLGVSDARDLVFAHLGLAVDYRQDPKALSVDYTLSCAQIFTEAARYMIEQGALDKVLDHVWNVETADRLPGLPFWAPDWTVAKSSRENIPITNADFLLKFPSMALSFPPWTQIPMRLIYPGWEIGSVARLSEPLSYLKKSQDEVRNAWVNIVGDSSIYFSTESEERLEDQKNRQIHIALYNELLQIFGFDLQHLRVPHDVDCADHYLKEDMLVLDLLKTEYHEYEDIPVHPLALISAFSLGLSEKLQFSQGFRSSPHSVIEQILISDRNRLGLLDLIRKSTEMKKHPTIDTDRLAYFQQMPFGLFPDFVQENDKICVLSGCQKTLVCRTVEKSEDEDDGQHLIILGECYINWRIFFDRHAVTNGPVTHFIFH